MPLQPPQRRALLGALCCVRVGLLPLLLLSNVQPRARLPLLLGADWVPITCTALLGLSNGYLATSCITVGPRSVLRYYK